MLLFQLLCDSKCLWVFYISYSTIRIDCNSNDTLTSRPGRSLHVVAGDTCLQQVYERPSTSLSSSGDAARVPPWAIALRVRLPHPHKHTHAHTRTPHSVPGGKQPGARSAAHPARRGWEGGQTTTTTLLPPTDALLQLTTLAVRLTGIGATFSQLWMDIGIISSSIRPVRYPSLNASLPFC